MTAELDCVGLAKLWSVTANLQLKPFMSVLGSQIACNWSLEGGCEGPRMVKMGSRGRCSMKVAAGWSSGVNHWDSLR